MKMFSRMSIKPFALVAVAGLLAAVAHAQTDCGTICQNYGQQAYNAVKASSAQQMTTYCNTLTDPNAKAGCLAAVPSYSEAQAQAAYTQTVNQCAQGCHG
jgi:hypothetical protein